MLSKILNFRFKISSLGPLGTDYQLAMCWFHACGIQYGNLGDLRVGWQEGSRRAGKPDDGEAEANTLWHPFHPASCITKSWGEQDAPFITAAYRESFGYYSGNDRG